MFWLCFKQDWIGWHENAGIYVIICTYVILLFFGCKYTISQCVFFSVPLQGTNGSQLWDSTFATQAFLEASFQ